MKLLRQAALLSSLVFLCAAQIILSARLWLNLPDDPFAWLARWDCIVRPLCELRFQPHFGIALIIVVLGVVLFQLIGKGPALSPLPLFSAALHLTDVRWSRIFRLLLLLCVGVVILFAYVAVTAGNPPPLLWLCVLALVAFAFACADRAANRPALLTRTELAWLIGYIVWLLALAFAFRNDGTRLIVIAVTLIGAAWLMSCARASREAIALVVVVTLAFAVYTLDLMSWRYAFIGDEYAFYEFANNIIHGANRPYLLSPRGAYDVHPVFATVVQVATITLYGNDIYGWRVSETLAILLSALPLYVFARTFVGARAALLAVIVYVSSQHLLGLSKVGYTYSQLFVPLLGALALCALALRRGSWLGVFLCAVASAFAFYTFAFGIPFIVLPLLLFLLYAMPRRGDISGRSEMLKHRFAIAPTTSRSRPTTTNRVRVGGPFDFASSCAARNARRQAKPAAQDMGRLGDAVAANSFARHTAVFVLAIFILGVGLTALPSLSDAEALQRIAGHTIANSEVKTTNTLTEQVIPNFLYTATASLAFLGHSHYVSGAHLDPLASLLMLLGVASIVTLLTRNRFAWWLLISFLLVCFFVGGFAPYPYPPIARTYILLPFYGLFVAIGATALTTFVRSERTRTMLWFLFMFAIPALNLYQFFLLTDGVNPQEDVPLIVKEFQEQPNVSTFYVVTRPTFNANVTRMILRAYNLDADKLVVMSDDNPSLSLPAIQRSGKGEYVILLTWHMPSLDRWHTGLRAQWPALSAVLLSDGTALTHFAKLVVNANVSADSAPTPAPSTAPPFVPLTTGFVVSPDFLPRIVGQWAVPRPRDVAVGPDGLVYVINGESQRVEAHSKDGKLQRTLTGNWREPFALAFNSRGELLVLDTAGPIAVTLLRADGSVVARSSNELAPASPRGLAVDRNDDVYIADTSKARIVRLSRDLLLPTTFSTTAPLAQPTSLTFVGDQLIVADPPNLFVLSPSGAVVAQWRITPYNTSQPPRFLAAQTDGIVMTNPEPGEIVLYDLQGRVRQTIGPPNYERLRKPLGIAATSDGKVFVADEEGDAVRVLDWGRP